MATTTGAIIQTQTQQEAAPPLVLRLQSNNPRRIFPHVTFHPSVVDNEHLGRQKSNCCCHYVRPRDWNDPSTWEQDEAETEHCRGHTRPGERERAKQKVDECCGGEGTVEVAKEGEKERAKEKEGEKEGEKEKEEERQMKEEGEKEEEEEKEGEGEKKEEETKDIPDSSPIAA